MSDKIKNILFFSFIGIFAILGILLRILMFSYARPLWNDECALGLNLLNRNYAELFSVLDYSQTAPPLFSCFEKFFASLQSLNLFEQTKIEYLLRLPSLIFGISAIILFYFLCRKIIENKVGQILAFSLFCINYQLIYYSQELKQYSSDIFAFIIILFSYFYINLTKTKKSKLFFYGLIFALSLWFSYASIFAIVSVLLLLLIKNRKNIKSFLIFCAPIFVSAAFFLIFKQNLNTSYYLHAFWSQGFLNWNFSNFFKIINDNINFYFFYFKSSWFICILLGTSFVFLFKNIKTETNKLVLIPFFAAIILSYLHIYPFYNRVSIYFLPIVILWLGKLFDIELFKNKALLTFFSIIIFAYFGFNNFSVNKLKIFEKEYYEECTPQLLKIAETKMKPDDTLYVISKINYEMYKNTVNIKNVVTQSDYFFDIISYEKAIKNLEKGKTYYLLMTHSPNKISEFNAILEILKSQKNVEIISDNNLNLLARFSAQ